MNNNDCRIHWFSMNFWLIEDHYLVEKAIYNLGNSRVSYNFENLGLWFFTVEKQWMFRDWKLGTRLCKLWFERFVRNWISTHFYWGRLQAFPFSNMRYYFILKSNKYGWIIFVNKVVPWKVVFESSKLTNSGNQYTSASELIFEPKLKREVNQFLRYLYTLWRQTRLVVPRLPTNWHKILTLRTDAAKFLYKSSRVSIFFYMNHICSLRKFSHFKYCPFKPFLISKILISTNDNLRRKFWSDYLREILEFLGWNLVMFR